MTARKSRAEHERERRSHRPLPLPEPLGVGVPLCPPDFTSDEQRCWFAILDSLPPGLLTCADQSTLEIMAASWARYWQVKARISEVGLLVRGADGNPVRNPLLMVEKQCLEQMHLMGRALGLSPQARLKLVAPESQPLDATEVLLRYYGDNVVPLPRSKT